MFFQNDDNYRLIRKYDAHEPVDVILQHLRKLGFVNAECLRSFENAEFYGKEGTVPAGNYIIVHSSSSFGMLNIYKTYYIIYLYILNKIILILE